MTKSTETAMKLLESLPEELQEHVVTKLSKLVDDARDESRWKELFSHDSQLRAAARRARQDIAAGHAADMDYERL